MAGEFVIVQFGDVFAAEVIVAGIDDIEQANEIQQSAFAGAGGAHDGDIFAAEDAEIDGLEDVQAARAEGVEFVDILELDEGACHNSPQRRPPRRVNSDAENFYYFFCALFRFGSKST